MRNINTDGEVWRDFPIDGFEDFFEISSVGRIRSKSRAIRRVNRFDTQYTNYVGGKILSERTNGTDPHIYATVQFTHPTTRKLISKTVYPHKLVALAFVPKPNPNFDKVTFKDRDATNIVPENLLWTDQSYLSTRSMIEHPHNRNKMGNHQRKAAIPTEDIKAKVIKLHEKGFDVYTIGEKMGRSRSWGYSHVSDILKEEKIRIHKMKSKEH